MKSKNTAVILAFFLGGFGGHKFYLGKTGVGIMYALFAWAFIPFLLGFVDMIVLLTMDDNKFNALYNAGSVPATLPAQPQPQNIVVNVQNSAASSGGADLPGQIKALHDLHSSGALTQEEFDEQKQRLLVAARR